MIHVDANSTWVWRWTNLSVVSEVLREMKRFGLVLEMVLRFEKVVAELTHRAKVSENRTLVVYAGGANP
jgi:hypothetical protein